MSKTQEFCDFADSDALASQIAYTFQEYEMKRAGARRVWDEVSQYIFATDTRSTSVGHLWKNSVHIPKTCQIYDSLHSNLLPAIWPNEDALAWEGDDMTSQTKEKRKVVKAYMDNKLRLFDFSTELSKCILDAIKYGNCFATVEYVAEKRKDEITGETHTGRVGPRMVRISPLDICFDPTAASFEDSPKLIRSIKTLGDLKREIEDYPEKGYYQEVFDKLMHLRGRFSGANQGDVSKNSQFSVDGFATFLDYFKSDYVEVIDFYGDIYDEENKKLLRNQAITIVDRAYVIRKTQLDNWFGRAPFFHAGWRLRPDNLYAMGPLDNLIGMQYRIDHLENAKADALDWALQPMLKVRGAVEGFTYIPGQHIYVGDEGDVEFMHPDVSILQYDTQIEMYERKMEMMAGAPAEAQGFRTPGEKTAYEVQIMDAARNKIFINKAKQISKTFLEPIWNFMLEMGRRNLGTSETIKVEDEDFNYEEFLTITREDITATGTIRAIGADRYERNANLLQSVTQLAASPLYMDPSVNTHISGKKIAHMLADVLNITSLGIIEDNVRVIEAVETQQMQSDGQQVLMEKGAIPTGPPGAPPQAQGSAAAVPGMGQGPV